MFFYVLQHSPVASKHVSNVLLRKAKPEFQLLHYFADNSKLFMKVHFLLFIIISHRSVVPNLLISAQPFCTLCVRMGNK